MLFNQRPKIYQIYFNDRLYCNITFPTKILEKLEQIKTPIFMLNH